MAQNLPATNAHDGSEVAVPVESTSIADQRAAAGLAAIDAEAAVIEKALPTVQVYIDGGMAPARYLPSFQENKNSPAQGRDVALAKGLAAAAYGATLGFGVAKSLQNVFTVHGQPAIYARTMVALVQAAGHEVWDGDKGPNSVTVYARRRGSDKVHESTWTMDRAVKAGFTRNPKYSSQPEEMLWAKAAATVCRRGFADVLEGIPYTVEDLEMEPVRATSERMDRPSIPAGAGARGALGALKQRHQPQPEPQDAEATEDSLSLFLAAIRDAGDLDQLGDVSAQVYQAKQENLLTDEEYEQLGEAGTKRKAELA